MYNEKRYYIKNSTLMEEIHKSKLTYCCYEEDAYANYDVICSTYALLTPNILIDFFQNNEGRDYVIVRIMTNEHVVDNCKNKKINLQELKMTPFKHFKIDRVVFDSIYKKYMTNLIEIDKLTKENEEYKDTIRQNNKSIKYFLLDKNKQTVYKEDNRVLREKVSDNIGKIEQLSKEFSQETISKSKEVLRSHWVGKTIADGEFCCDKGKLTNDLVHMIINFVDQYARSGNWAGYTYLEDMKGFALVHLCDVALKFEESKSSNAFAYFTQIVANKFIATLNLEKVQSRIKSTMMQEAGYNPTFNEQIIEEYKNMELYSE